MREGEDKWGPPTAARFEQRNASAPTLVSPCGGFDGRGSIGSIGAVIDSEWERGEKVPVELPC